MKLKPNRFPPTAARGPAMFLLLAVLLAGCMAAGERAEVRSFPREQLPTVIALTIQAIDGSNPASSELAAPTNSAINYPSTTPEAYAAPTTTPSPTTLEAVSIASPEVTMRAPTATRTTTPTPQAPLANIQINRPGPASRVISPLKVNASLLPGARGNVRLELLGEDGRVLVRKIQTYHNNPNVRIHVNLELDFEISAVAEAARLVISTEDPQGRLISLSTVDLILLSLGEEEINPSGNLSEPIIIREPARNLLIQGGNVVVSGLVRPRGKDPLLVQMFNAEGQQVGPARLVSVDLPEDGSHAPFSVEVPYSVSAPTWVRVMVVERDFRIPSTLHLSSVEVLLSP